MYIYFDNLNICLLFLLLFVQFPNRFLTCCTRNEYGFSNSLLTFGIFVSLLSLGESIRRFCSKPNELDATQYTQSP